MFDDPTKTAEQNLSDAIGCAVVGALGIAITVVVLVVALVRHIAWH